MDMYQKREMRKNKKRMKIKIVYHQRVLTGIVRII